MKVDNYYLILGVAPSANLHEIKKAYRKLALQYHPDVYKNEEDDLASNFRQIQQAYATLSDPYSRKEHDRSLANLYGKKYFSKKQVGYNGLIETLTELSVHLSKINKNRIDFDQLYLSILIPVRDANASIYNTPEIQQEESALSLLLSICNYLPYKEILALQDEVSLLFRSSVTKAKWLAYLQQKKWEHRRANYVIWLALLCSIIATLLIIWSTK